MEAVRLFERGTWWGIDFKGCWHITLLYVTLLQKSLGIPSKFSDIKGWKWIGNVKYEPTCVAGKILPSLWNVRLCRVGRYLCVEFLVVENVSGLEVARWVQCHYKNILWQLFRNFYLSFPGDTDKVIESPIMGPLIKFSWVHLYGACEINHQFHGKCCCSIATLTGPEVIQAQLLPRKTSCSPSVLIFNIGSSVIQVSLLFPFTLICR